MKRILTILLLAACSIAAQAQTAATLPANFAGFGFGYQKTGVPTQTSGWSNVCHQIPAISFWGASFPAYLCDSNDYMPGVTSVRANVDTVVVHKGWFAGGTKTGAGAAISTAGLGGSFDLGLWGSIDISKKTGMAGLRLLASLTWEKDDVSVAASQKIGAGLKTLGDRAQFRVGFGKTW